MKDTRKEKQNAKTTGFQGRHPLRRILLGQALIVTGSWSLSSFLQLGVVM